MIYIYEYGPDGSARTPWDRAGTPIASVDVEDEVAVVLINGLLLWGAGRDVGSNGANNLKPLLSNPPFGLPSPFSTLFL